MFLFSLKRFLTESSHEVKESRNKNQQASNERSVLPKSAQLVALCMHSRNCINLFTNSSSRTFDRKPEGVQHSISLVKTKQGKNKTKQSKQTNNQKQVTTAEMTIEKGGI